MRKRSLSWSPVSFSSWRARVLRYSVKRRLLFVTSPAMVRRPPIIFTQRLITRNNQRSTSLRLSSATAFPTSFACSSLPIFLSSYPLLPVSATYPFTRKTSRPSSSLASCSRLSTCSRSKTTKKCSVTPFRLFATSLLARRRISSRL